MSNRDPYSDYYRAGKIIESGISNLPIVLARTASLLQIRPVGFWEVGDPSGPLVWKSAYRPCSYQDRCPVCGVNHLPHATTKKLPSCENGFDSRQ